MLTRKTDPSIFGRAHVRAQPELLFSTLAQHPRIFSLLDAKRTSDKGN